MRPGDFARSGINVEEALASFTTLGLGPDRRGVAGRSPESPRSGPLRQARSAPTVGADGISGSNAWPRHADTAGLAAAWPRRYGRAGGRKATGVDSIPRQQNEVSSQMQQISRLMEQYFPSGQLCVTGNWMLLTYNSEVPRTGHVELGKDERLTNVYMERMFPGIKIGSTMGTTRMLRPKIRGRCRANQSASTSCSRRRTPPLPPAEDLLPPAKQAEHQHDVAAGLWKLTASHARRRLSLTWTTGEGSFDDAKDQGVLAIALFMTVVLPCRRWSRHRPVPIP